MSVELDTLVIRRALKAQFDKTSDTTLADVQVGGVGLVAPLEAGEWYTFRAVFQIVAPGGGYKYTVGCTSAPTMISWFARYETSVSRVATGTGEKTGVGSGSEVTGGTIADLEVVIEGTVQANAAADLSIQFAQNASNGTASSVLAGAHLTVHKIP